MRRDPSRTFAVRGGVRLSEGDEGYLYRFQAEVEIPIPPDTPVTVGLEGGESARGVLVALQDFDLLIATQVDLGEGIASARVSSDPWFIWQMLAGRLQEIESECLGDLTVPLALAGLTSAHPGIDEAAADSASARLQSVADRTLRPNPLQCVAMGRCAASALHYVWGPPGTGKTANLAQVAATLASRGERVLVLAHANVAVDVAILRVADAFEGTRVLADNRILRVGVPQLGDVRRRGDITPEDALRKTQPDLVDLKERLERSRSDLARKLRTVHEPQPQRLLVQQLEGVRKDLARVREIIASATATLLAEATILACTLSRFAIDDRVFRWPADAVLVDEAGMAPFPAVLAAGIRTRRRMALFGDFRQLPPIVLSTKRDAKQWMGRDAFAIGGVVDAVEAGQEDPRVTLLPTQYRMSTPIAATVSDLAYGGRLRTAAGVDEGNIGLAHFGPAAGCPAVLVDTSLLDPVCLREPRAGSFSRANPVHAAFAVGLAEGLLAQGCPRVALVTPYRAQARLQSAMFQSHPARDRLRAATVHRFQGAESEAVIVDLVDAAPLQGASQLTGKDRDTARRLVNVALSRAKGKLLVLVPEGFVRSTQGPAGVVRTAARLLREHGVPWQPAPADAAASLHCDGIDWMGAWESAEVVARELLARARDRLVVNIPATLRWSDDAVAELREAARRVRHTLVFCPPDVAEVLEETPAVLRLMSAPGGCFMLADGTVALVGGTSGDGLFARIQRARAVVCLEELLLGDWRGAPAPQAEVEHALDAVCGRCPECGEVRRPRKAGGRSWVLGCPSQGHRREPLRYEGMRPIVAALGIRCTACGRQSVLRDGPHGIYLGCLGHAAGCPSRVPRLEDLFPGS
ncbi:MAG: AAA domain-containing protein [Candidatus Latescibacterota bacterium]